MQKSRTENNLRQHLLSNTQQNPTQPGHQVTVIQVPRHPPSIQPTLSGQATPHFSASFCHLNTLLYFSFSRCFSWNIKYNMETHQTKNNGKTSGEEPERFLRGGQSPDTSNYKARSAQRQREMHPQGRSKLRAVRASKKLHFWSPQPRGHRLGSPPLGTGSSWARGGIPAQPGEGCRSCLLPVQCQQGCWAPSVGTAAFHCPSRDGKRKSSGSFEQLPAHGWTQRL